jgi:hypothetical protein
MRYAGHRRVAGIGYTTKLRQLKHVPRTAPGQPIGQSPAVFVMRKRFIDIKIGSELVRATRVASSDVAAKPKPSP